MKTLALKLLTCIILATISPICLADIPNSKDPANIKRYEGSEIVRYENLAYERFIVPLGKMTNFDFGTKVAEFEKSEPLEGELTRVSYRIPDAQRSSLEIYRNYETALTDSGWTIEYRASGKQEFGNAFTHIYESLRNNDQLFTYNDMQGHFLVAKKAAEGLTAALFVTKFENGLTGATNVQKGEPIVQLDVVRTKVMEQKMVVVTSSEMAKSINDSGRVSLYGILFDFNKSDIKSESEPTLQQITNLLNEKPDLKLLVVGHTDNVGNFEFNRDLSQRRAQAVVSWLSQKSGVSAARLSPFGASFAAPVASNETEDGRAKNRRVELVPMAK
jgi:OOP family OmpA-OmpF porin